MKVMLFVLGILFGPLVIAQPPSYPCKTEGSEYLSRLIGTWHVSARDRISPGNYESNTGVSVISADMQGCSVSEAYQGLYKGKAYAISATILLKDSMKVQRFYFDSEHANAMLFDGDIREEGMQLYWFLNKESQKMQVRYEMSIPGADTFEWKTHLSTDYGKTWQLTHHWEYRRLTPYAGDQDEHVLIKTTIDNYHKGLSNGDSDIVLDALAPQFIMFNGNFSGDVLNWQAHMFLTGDELQSWPNWFVKEAGPYQNTYDILSVQTRANAALVITRDTGKNKFREWQNEQTVWLLGKEKGQYKILAYYLKDISNP